ncbi:MAG: DUF4301 family protein [Bacteroidales bacterium]|nr:DUF4301 family protein [Bacteroidales bacterium]HOY39008.1 DUF4301 family protein [Bacteroidales bacterium]HQP03471.1 DUF4301 family protein [Bacteroidales bacterium]
MFTPDDVVTLRKRGIQPDEAYNQIEMLRKGTQFIELQAPATEGNGILALANETERFCRIFDAQRNRIAMVRFVPASGAASRMFKRLIDVASKTNLPADDFHGILADMEFYSVGNTLRNINRFAFARQLAHLLGVKYPIEVNEKNFRQIAAAIIQDRGLNYMNLPKGLLLFHEYEGFCRTAFEEHISEGLQYAVGKCNCLNQHFTVSPEHLNAFTKLKDRVVASYEKSVELQIEFSQQLPSTDTLAVDEDGHPFRNADGSLLFRPGGHGALIENLNTLDAELVFIKNIDNIVPDYLKPETITYKKLIAGVLLEIKDTIFTFLKKLDQNTINQAEIDVMMDYARNVLNIVTAEKRDVYLDSVAFLRKKLNRPIRVCGMVKNTGEPGGGPFWVKHSDGSKSLQIVEKAQINLSISDQRMAFDASTHFNPVDLVCWITDYNGKKFDLLQFRDNNTFFVASKTHNARALSALELPGLWNGAMADWITLFVEVPLITFNPVKEVNDLLRSEHQPVQ